MNVHGYTLWSKSFNRYFRGYFWGRFLSPSHVQILGGYEKIEREAPVYLTERLSNGAMYLQATEDINTLTLEDLRPIKHYLSPVLVPRQAPAVEPVHFQHLKVFTDED